MARRFISRESAQRFAVAIILALLLCTSATAQIATDYYYDALGRLTAAVNSDGKTVAYAYDKAGNRIRVSNDALLSEIRPTVWSASNSIVGTGLSTANGMRDRVFNALASTHATAATANSWIMADFGSAKHLDHVDLAPSSYLSYGVGNLNAMTLQWSTNGTTWTTIGQVSGAILNAYVSIPAGGVSARYVRLLQPTTTILAVGDFRFYSSGTTSGGGGHAPTAASFVVSVPPGIPTPIDPSNYISDPDGDPLTLTAGQPGHGATAITNGGTRISYTPNPGFGGQQDSFSYTVNDGHNGSATAQITVNVGPVVNVSLSSPTYQRFKRWPGDTVSPTYNGGTPNNVNCVATGGTTPYSYSWVRTGGDLSTQVNGQGTSQANWIRPFDSVGDDFISTWKCVVTDANNVVGQSPTNVEVEILYGDTHDAPPNLPPVAPNFAITVNPAPTTTAIDLLAPNRISDPEYHALSITALNSPTAAHAGTATKATGVETTINYLPNAGATSDSFSYSITDGTNVSTGLISVTINTSQPPAPTIGGGSLTVYQNGSGDVALSPSGNWTSVQIASGPSHGSASISGTTAHYVAGGVAGSDYFTVQAVGPGGTSSPATVSVTVTAIAQLVATPSSSSWVGGRNVVGNQPTGAGPITITVTGGSGSYSYSWSRTGGDTQTSATGGQTTSFYYSGTVTGPHSSSWNCHIVDSVTGATADVGVSVTYDLETNQ